MKDSEKLRVILAAIDEKIKKCKKCNRLLLTTEFYIGKQRGKNEQQWEFYDSFCKSCRRDYNTERRRQIKRQAVEHLGGKCMKCGLIDSVVVYDFHHKNPDEKDFAIGQHAKSFATIKAELDKCILLCANCHRKLHY